jgi:undecaprenyl-diphosphatase
MLDIFQAFILGIIQGITAWIPVSSKTQVILFGKLFFGLNFMTAVSFALLVHVGDLIATLVLFRKEITGFIRIKPDIADLKSMETADPERSLFWFVVISVIFSGLIGLPLYLLTRDTFSDLPGTLFLAVVGMVLVILGSIMWYSSTGTDTTKGTALKKRISFLDTILVGCAQGLAVIPGISRSGITESTLLIRGYTPKEAVRLSFFMSIPMIFLSISTFFFLEGFGTLTLTIAIVGITAAFIASFFTMNVMLILAEKVKFYYFNIAIGLLAILPFVMQMVFS